MGEILTAEQVAKILQVHPFTVLKFIKQGKLKASKLGRVYRIRRRDVDEFLDNQIEQKAQKSNTTKQKKATKSQKTDKASGSPKTKDQKTPKNIEIGPPLEVPTKEVPAEDHVEESAKAESTAAIKKEPPVRSDQSDLDHYILELKGK